MTMGMYHASPSVAPRTGCEISRLVRSNLEGLHADLIQIVHAEAEVAAGLDVARLATGVLEGRQVAGFALVVDDFDAHGVHGDRICRDVERAVRDARLRVFVE